MNHQMCGCNAGFRGLGDGGARGRGPTKAQFEEQLARDIAQRVVAHLEGRPSLMGAWVTTVMSGRKIVDVKNVWVTPTASVVQLRINAHLIDAPDHVRNDAALYFTAVLLRDWGKGRLHAARLAAWYNTNPPAPKTYKRSGETVRPDGLDLNDLYQRLVATHIHGTHFEREADWDAVRLTWGKRSKPTRRMQLALYTANDKTITVHGNLQDSRVPGYVIADNLWHEMMHHWQAESGRGLSHNAEFRRVEKLFSGHTMSTAWLERNKGWLFGRSEDVT